MLANGACCMLFSSFMGPEILSSKEIACWQLATCWRACSARDAGEEGAEDEEEPKEDEDEEELELSPEKGNVAFASAADGWAFRTGQFAALYAAKLGFSAAALGRALWGDFRLDAKAKRIARIKASQAGKHKPLFVQARLLAAWSPPACRAQQSALPFHHLPCAAACIQLPMLSPAYFVSSHLHVEQL